MPVHRCRFHLSGTLLATLVLASCGSPPPPPSQEASCRIRPEADVALRRAHDYLLLPVQLEGRDMLMMLDTGSEISTLSPGIVAALGLPTDQLHGRVLLGVGGRVRTGSVVVPSFALGTTAFGSAAPGPMRFSVGTADLLPGTDPPVAGLLGADVLAGRDLTLDAPHGRARIVSVIDCPHFWPWPDAEPAASPDPGVALRRGPGGLAVVPVDIGGQRVDAMLDTGARMSVMTRRLAASLGVDDSVLAADPAATAIGISRARIELRRHRFDAISLGRITWHDVTVAVTDATLPQTELLLGADLLARQEIWIGQTQLWLR